MSVITQTYTQNSLVLRLKNEKESRVYKQGEYMTHSEKKEWYTSHGYMGTGDARNQSILMPDGTYYWFLSERDMHDECMRADGGGD